MTRPSLPEPPKKFEANVDPKTAKIVIAEIIPEKAPEQKLEAQFYKRHWLKTFNGSVQFSQAYVSPNWYQGGNKNLNMLVNLLLQRQAQPRIPQKFLFETTFQYKLGMNDAPNDSLRNYSVSEDLFQFNMLVGYKASKRWYYSTNVSFKTQFLKNYKPNTHELKGAFMSPGELNVGVGMTYNYANPKKTFTLDASISPLSWNMKTCFNKHMNETSYGIEPGRHTVSEYGSSAEGKMTWQICDNISMRSRLFVFSDYSYAYGDWGKHLYVQHQQIPDHPDIRPHALRLIDSPTVTIPTGTNSSSRRYFRSDSPISSLQSDTDPHYRHTLYSPPPLLSPTSDCNLQLHFRHPPAATVAADIAAVSIVSLRSGGKENRKECRERARTVAGGQRLLETRQCGRPARADATPRRGRPLALCIGRISDGHRAQ